MPSRLFRVDLSEGARDFQHTATEPGLPMLDPSGANYAILRQWLGDIAAEPHWEDQHTVSFHIRHEGRRLDSANSTTVGAAELEKGLKGDWETLQTKLRKARPETTTEQALHRVATKFIRTVVADPEANDFDCFLFKHRREGEPWRLVWCWGYQRIDQQPGRGTICRDGECNQLFVQRQGQKAICPGCQTATTRKVGGWSLGRWVTLLVAAALIAAVLFLLGGPKLSVTPNTWTGPVGASPTFKVESKRFFFFTTDVTAETMGFSFDSRVIEVASKGVAKAVGAGKTIVTFRHGDRVADAAIQVNPADPAVSLALTPASSKLGVGTTSEFKAMGKTADGAEIEMTEKIEWTLSDDTIAVLHDGIVEGAKIGKATLTATYRADAFSEPMVATAEIEVADLDLKSLRLAVEPSKLKRGQKAELTVDAIDKEGAAYSLAKSSRLSARIAPEDLAVLLGSEVTATKAGAGKIDAAFGDLKGSADLTVSDESLLPPGSFEVNPDRVDLAVHEYYRLNILTDDRDGVTVTSADTGVVMALDHEFLVGLKEGTTNVSVKKGDVTKTVEVTVHGAKYAEIFFDTDRITMQPGRRKLVRVFGRTADGGRVELSPTQLKWESQPLSEYVDFNRRSMYLLAKAPTPQPQRLVATLDGAVVADALVEVVGVGGIDTTTLLVDDGFGVYPPVPLLDLNVGRYVGRGVVFSGDNLVIDKSLGSDSILLRSGLTPGTVITGVDGRSFDGLTQKQIREYFLEHPLSDGSMLAIRRLDGTTARVALGETGELIQPVRIVGATYHAEDQGTKIYAKIRLSVTQAGEYRVLTPDSTPDAPWTACEAGLTPSITTDAFEKPTDKEFILIVERKRGEVVTRFPTSLKVPSDSDIKP